MNEQILNKLQETKDIKETKKLIKLLDPEQLTLQQITSLSDKLHNTQYVKTKEKFRGLQEDILLATVLYSLIDFFSAIILFLVKAPASVFIIINQLVTLTIPNACLFLLRKDEGKIITKNISDKNRTLSKLKIYMLTLKQQKINNISIKKKKDSIFKRIKNKLTTLKYDRLLKKYNPKLSSRIDVSIKVRNEQILKSLQNTNNVSMVANLVKNLDLSQLSLNELESLSYTLDHKQYYTEKKKINSNFYTAIRNSSYVGIALNFLFFVMCLAENMPLTGAIAALITLPIVTALNALNEKYLKQSSEYVNVVKEFPTKEDITKLNYCKSIIQKEIEFRKENFEETNNEKQKENSPQEKIIAEIDLTISNHITEIRNMIQGLPKGVRNKYKLLLDQSIAKYERKKRSLKEKEYFQIDYSQMYKNEFEKELLELKEKIEKEKNTSSKGEKGNLIMAKLNEIIDLKDSAVVCQAFSKLTQQIPSLIKDEDVIFINTIINLVSEYYLMILKKHPFINITRLINEIEPSFYQAIESTLERELINHNFEATILQQKETTLKKENDNKHYIEKLSYIYTQSIVKNSDKITAAR